MTERVLRFNSGSLNLKKKKLIALSQKHCCVLCFIPQLVANLCTSEHFTCLFFSTATERLMRELNQNGSVVFPLLDVFVSPHLAFSHTEVTSAYFLQHTNYCQLSAHAAGPSCQACPRVSLCARVCCVNRLQCRCEHLIRSSSIPAQDLCFVMERWVKCIAFGVTSS